MLPLLLWWVAAGNLFAARVVGIVQPGPMLHIAMQSKVLKNQWLYVTDGAENILAYAQVTGGRGANFITARAYLSHKSVSEDTLLGKPVILKPPEGYRWDEQEATLAGISRGTDYLISGAEEGALHGKTVLFLKTANRDGFMVSELLFVQDGGKKLPFYVFNTEGEKTTVYQAYGVKVNLSEGDLGKKLKISFLGEGKRPIQPSVAVKTSLGEIQTIHIPLSEIVPRMPEPKDNPYKIVIDTARNRLYLFEQNNPIRTYLVGTGRFGLETPEGTYEVIEKVKDPSFLHPSGRVVEGGSPANPLGRYWLGLNKFGTYEGYEGQYGIHGTNRPDTVGHNVSHGCIRMRNEDIGWLYEHIPPGTPVEIIHGPKWAKKNKGG